MKTHSIYIHIPFCIQRCGYCDFNTYAGLEHLIPRYVDAIVKEIECLRNPGKNPIQAHTIFFGGGTPSLLPVESIQKILGALREHFWLPPGTEISLEANPGTLSRPYLEGLRGAGVNRLSLGMQSAHPGELHLLERRHDYPQVIQSVEWARQAGFENINLDLIFGLPEQTLARWQNNLELALGLHPEHFALYALTIEDGTPFGNWARRGLLSAPDPDLGAEMYEWASERLESENYTQYEISNWARDLASEPADGLNNPAFACQHNLQYWHNLPYLGLGAGAHGYAGGVRTANILTPQAYILHLEQHTAKMEANLSFPLTPTNQTTTTIEPEAEMGETMMMALRLTREGISESIFQDRFGRSLEETFGTQIKRLTSLGLLEWAGITGEVLRLTKQGRLLGNQVFLEFL